MRRIVLLLFFNLFASLSYPSEKSGLHSDEQAIDLNGFEKSLYSKNGEDGILSKLFQIIEPVSKYCVEVGAHDGVTGSKTYLLRLQSWKSLLLDRSHEMPKYNLHQELITAININQLFSKYEVPLEFDLLSISIHYNDFYVWKALDAKYKPAVVVIEYNGIHGPDEDKVVKYRPFFNGDGTDYFGASFLALYHLGRSKGYSLVYAEKTGVSLFFVRDDLILEKNLIFNDMNDPAKIYRRAANLYYQPDKKNRPYLSSSEL